MIANGIQDWNIEIVVTEAAKEYATEEEVSSMAILTSCMYEYQKATILLVPFNIPDEKEFVSTIQHEFYHIIMSVFDLCFESVIGTCKSEKARQIASEYYVKCHELAVRGLELRK